MPTGPSGSVFVLIVGPPSLAGTTTAVTNYDCAAVRTPPTLEASVNPLHANRTLRQCLRAHRRSSVPCRDYNRRYQLRLRRRANSANARSVGKSSACQPDPQAVSSCSSSVLRPLPGLQPTLPTTAAQLHAGLPKAHGTPAALATLHASTCRQFQ